MVFSDQTSPKCDDKPGAPLAVLAAALVERALPLHQHPLVEVVVLQIPVAYSAHIVSHHQSWVMNRYLPNWRPSVDVEPGLVLRVEGPEDFGELAADLVVVLRQVMEAPVAQL